MSSLEIRVTGTSTVRRCAERAVLNIRIVSEGESQDLVSDHVSEASTRIQTRLGSLATKTEEGQPAPTAAITLFSMTSLRTRSFAPFDNRSPADKKEALPRRFEASSNFTAIFQDFGTLGEVATELLKMKHVEIQSTSWQLTEITRASLGSDVRKGAIRDAIAKAEDYAEVLEQKIKVVEVVDNGSSSKNRARGHMSAKAAKVGVRTPVPAYVMEVAGLALEPEDIEICSTVEVKFVAA